MTDKNVIDYESTESIVELFHKVESLVPKDQKLVTISPNTTISNALLLMGENGFSQLPVVSGKAVLGMFSYRSLAHNLIKHKSVGTDFLRLPVDEFMEIPTYIQPKDKWEMILNVLEQDDVVLVGNQDDLQAILTSTDVINHLHRLAGAFIKLAEIETSLRRIIDACVENDELELCIQNSLKDKYIPEKMPHTLSEMTLNDYVQIIGDGRNYGHFERVFGPTDWQRKQTIIRFKAVVELRNDSFHFRRQLDDQDFTTLTEHRDWLEMKTRSFVGGQEEQGQGSGSDDQPPIKPTRRKTTRKEFITACDPTAADFFNWMLDEAEKRKIIINWGTVGFSVRTAFGKRLVSVAYGYPPDLFQVYLDKKLELSDATESIWRQELLAFNVLEERSRYTLSGQITPETNTSLREIFTHLLARVTALTLYPLNVRVTIKDKTYHAVMLDEKGRILFDNQEYSSSSAAAVAASGWQTANGWTFWHYYDESSGGWRPIDDLRK